MKNGIQGVVGALVAATLLFSSFAPARADGDQKSQESQIEQLLSEYDQLAAKESDIVSRLQNNITLKKSIEARRSILKSDTESYSRDVVAANSFCSGVYPEPEYSRRKKECADKGAGLEAREKFLEWRRAELDESERARLQNAETIKASYEEIQKRGQVTEDDLARISSFAAVIEACHEKTSLREKLTCFRAHWAASRKNLAAPAASFCAAKLKVGAEERAIQQMNFTNDTRSFEMFAEVSAHEKAKLEKKVVDALLDQGLEATKVAADSAKSLNPYNVNTTIKKLRARGLDNDSVIADLRKIAATKDKPAMAAAYKDLVDDIKIAKDGYDTAKDMSEDAENAHLRLLLAVLKVAQGDPGLGLVVTGADFGISLAYLGYISGQVDDLNQVTDTKLLGLHDLTERLKKDVGVLNAAKRDWAKEHSGEPDCHT